MPLKLPAAIARWLGEGDDAWLARLAYLLGGRRPWSIGYSAQRAYHLARCLRDECLMSRFRERGCLPVGYGIGLDERVVEYPWALSRLAASDRVVLDAGAVLTMPEVIRYSGLGERSLITWSLDHQWRAPRSAGLDVRGDLRRLGLRSESVDVVVCISTLEHVGLDNSRYVGDERFREAQDADHLVALREAARVLRPGGALLLTVPFGRPAFLGWMRQFDAAGVAAFAGAFGACSVEETYYRYSPAGWQRADAAQCGDCQYFDVVAGTGAGSDGAAAARAVACLELRRPGEVPGPASPGLER